jgi:uncharacterized protein (TIGR02001 family)
MGNLGRRGWFGAFVAVPFVVFALPACAESDFTLSGTASLVTQYVDRGITNSAEKPALQPEFDLYYKELFYVGIWASNVDFGTGPNGKNLAHLEIDYYAGFTPTFGKWKFEIAPYYVAYPGAFDPDGNFDYFELWTGVKRSFFDDKLSLQLYNYWSPNYFGETGNNDIVEFGYGWTFGKVGKFTPKLAGNLGHQWGTLSQGGYDYTYWSIALAFSWEVVPPLEFELRYWDSFDFNGFTCPASGVDACNNLVVGSVKATF